MVAVAAGNDEEDSHNWQRRPYPAHAASISAIAVDESHPDKGRETYYTQALPPYSQSAERRQQPRLSAVLLALRRGRVSGGPNGTNTDHIPFPIDLPAMAEVTSIADPKGEATMIITAWTKMLVAVSLKTTAALRKPDFMAPATAPRHRTLVVIASWLKCAPAAAAAVAAAAFTPKSSTESPRWIATWEQ